MQGRSMTRLKHDLCSRSASGQLHPLDVRLVFGMNFSVDSVDMISLIDQIIAFLFTLPKV